MEKKATISDVAKQSGVSKTTVSRYINGKYENISAETRARIQYVMDELSYRPNKTAQRLKSGKSMLIGCVLGDMCSPFAALLLKGVTDVCDGAGYQVLFADSNDDPVRERAAVESLVANRVDGLIVNTAGENEMLFRSLKEQGIPVVLADRGLMTDGVIDTVDVDNETIAYDCVRRLAEFGYRKVAFFTEGNKAITPRIKRYSGYQRGVRDFLPEQKAPEYYQFIKGNDESTMDCIRRFQGAHQGERIAILAVNGVATQSIMFAMNRMGCELGFEFGLCSFDNWDWLQLNPSGIMSVDLPTRRMGQESVKLLLDRISGVCGDDVPGRLVQLPVEIIVRCKTFQL